MSLRFHEIAETYHRILNPFSEEQLMLLGEICRLHPGTRLLDLASGKGEMVLSNQDGWDRYEAPQWMAVDDFLRTILNDHDAAALGEWISSNRRAYFKYGRRYFSWGVFVLRLAHLGSLR